MSGADSARCKLSRNSSPNHWLRVLSESLGIWDFNLVGESGRIPELGSESGFAAATDSQGESLRA